DGHRDEMTISVVSDRPPDQFDDLAATVEARLHQATGVRIGVEVVGPGRLDHLTGFGTAAKLIRFRDDR
ncbi:MAG: hypothetical protein OEW85_02490, partial [Acidimicrobiia bacterium]|nr:hypothetical protein [Acidimicrobiia bacterium]